MARTETSDPSPRKVSAAEAVRAYLARDRAEVQGVVIGPPAGAFCRFIQRDLRADMASDLRSLFAKWRLEPADPASGWYVPGCPDAEIWWAPDGAEAEAALAQHRRDAYHKHLELLGIDQYGRALPRRKVSVSDLERQVDELRSLLMSKSGTRNL